MSSRQEFLKKKHRVGSNPYITMIIVLLASFCDFITIKSVMEYYLTESVMIQVVITATIAFILNYLPSLLGTTLRDKNTPNRKLLLIVLLVAFSILFVLSFLLRWNSRQLMFEDTANLNLIAEGATSSNIEIGAGENTLTIIMGCSTLFTSLLSFVFSFTAITPDEKKRQLMELRLAELESSRDVYQAHIDELERVIEENANEQREDGAYRAALENVEDFRVLFKEEVRMTLTEYLQNASAVSVVLQGEAPVVV